MIQVPDMDGEIDVGSAHLIETAVSEKGDGGRAAVFETWSKLCWNVRPGTGLPGESEQ